MSTIEVARHPELAAACALHKVEPLEAEPHDIVAALCTKAQATFHRAPNRPDGTVCVALERDNGDRLGAVGKNIAEAVNNLATRLESWPADAE